MDNLSKVRKSTIIIIVLGVVTLISIGIYFVFFNEKPDSKKSNSETEIKKTNSDVENKKTLEFDKYQLAYIILNYNPIIEEIKYFATTNSNSSLISEDKLSVKLNKIISSNDEEIRKHSKIVDLLSSNHLSKNTLYMALFDILSEVHSDVNFDLSNKIEE